MAPWRHADGPIAPSFCLFSQLVQFLNL
ncbi:uncharacterized protein G2W53_027395 [Senna tora]|uniref:Uncharacterized protein n=1 Tax=Senna tora TaxID=362788 RepID=A0A834THK6_9FABA|nr:uncharacterized protein G2W53_027395 [Senna tora]